MPLPKDIVNIIIDYAKCYTLLSWIDINKLDWNSLSRNPNAIDLLEANKDMIDYEWLSMNLSIFEPTIDTKLVELLYYI